ncbi:penicillin acylase family protein [Piscinibacter sp.]|uniref:penicillin acylase family protein n=1 Tax=Piscinibacter sp. TaxID=1903157 RepID=UPI0039E2852D
MTSKRMTARRLGAAWGIGAALIAGCGGGGSHHDAKYDVEIRRTAMGVPHIKAADYAGVGYGMGYAQAEDALCTIADAMLTYRGERSRWFGPDERVTDASTIGRPLNIDSDFFHRHVLSADAMSAFRAAQPAEVQSLMSGYADGYNRYLRDLRANASATAHAACRGAEWVASISTDDLYRRAYATNFAAGHANFLAEIANAQPPAAMAAPAAQSGAALPRREIAAAFAARDLNVGGSTGVGSNMYGLGKDATGGASMLFGNPHWYWRGPDRFYQAHLTIPNTLNVSGASFLGMPVILIGYNNDVAWSHTVSTARRFGFFQLTLAPGNPTSYVKDGATVAMTAAPISVQSKGADGGITTVTRTLYRTPDGPLVNLSALHPALAWSGASAYVIRDINATNYRTFKNWMRWARASSLDEFATIQREESAIPWVNTVAVARGSTQAWYADIGAMPNVTPQQVADCTTPIGMAIGAALPNTPFFDGSRSACDWVSDADSKQPGAIGPARMPSLLRGDYVANMNDSYWLSNPAQPLTGYPALIGTPGTQSLRTRLGHTLVAQRLDGSDGYGGKLFSVDILKQLVLNSRNLGAELFKEQALPLVCADASIAVTADSRTGEAFNPARTVDVGAACAALAAWDNTGNADARGAHLWDEFWTRASRIPAASLYAVPFDAADPIHTPRDLKSSAAAQLQQAFGAAVMRVQESGFAVDAPRGDYLFATRSGTRIPLFGGCGGSGYFTVACSERRIEQGGYSMDGDPNANSYMQIVNFAGATVEAHTFVTFSLSDDPASPHNADYTRRYSAKQWVRMPFTDAEIAADPDLKTQKLRE